jgi:nitrogenase iron protein NifH
MIEQFAKRLGTQMIHFVPRENDVQRAEIQRKTVIEWNPQCAQSDEYRTLARAIDGNQMFIKPKPLAIQELEDLLLKYGLLG